MPDCARPRTSFWPSRARQLPPYRAAEGIQSSVSIVAVVEPEWEGLVREARGQGMHGLLAYRYAQEAGPWQKVGAELYREQFILNVRLLSMLEAAWTALRSRGIAAMALKGAALTGWLAPWVCASLIYPRLRGWRLWLRRYSDLAMKLPGHLAVAANVFKHSTTDRRHGGGADDIDTRAVEAPRV